MRAVRNLHTALGFLGTFGLVRPQSSIDGNIPYRVPATPSISPFAYWNVARLARSGLDGQYTTGRAASFQPILPSRSSNVRRRYVGAPTLDTWDTTYHTSCLYF